MIEAARSGQRAVRLKGGDAFVFGRGGEEVEALRQAGVAYSVVPGITAALGAAAQFEVPLTFRNEALRITFLTAHKAGDADTVDWSALTDDKMTIVVYMGMTAAPRFATVCWPRAVRRKRRSACSRAPPGPTRKAEVGMLERTARAGRTDRPRARDSRDRRRGRAFRAVVSQELASPKLQPSALKIAGSCRMTSPLEQKKIKITGPSVVTANRTWDGAVIWRTAAHGWSAELADAAIVRTSDEARALLAEAVADDVGAVGAYIAPVEIKDTGAIKPGNLREQSAPRASPSILLPASLWHKGTCHVCI